MSDKVLVVEDESTLVETSEYNLVQEGHEVSTTMDGRAALETARREQPDLIVRDLMLPELDGFDVCRALRQEMTTPILMLTAREDSLSQDTERRRARSLVRRAEDGYNRVEMRSPSPAK